MNMRLFTQPGTLTSGSGKMAWLQPIFDFAPVVVSPTLSWSGPSFGTVSLPSSNFTVTITGGTIVGTINCTPNDGGGGGTFIPTSVAITDGSRSATFTYTPATTGLKMLSLTNDGGLANPSSLSYTSVAQPSPPSGGNVNVDVGFALGLEYVDFGIPIGLEGM